MIPVWLMSVTDIRAEMTDAAKHKEKDINVQVMAVSAQDASNGALPHWAECLLERSWFED